MTTSQTSEHRASRRHRRRRHRRLRPGRCRAGDPARPAGMAGGRARAVGGALPAAPRRALRPRGRPHPAVVRHRRSARQDQRAGRHLRVPERRPQAARAVRARRQRPVGLAPVVHVLPARARGAAVRPRRRALRIEVRRGVQVVGLDDDGEPTVHGERVDIEPDGTAACGCGAARRRRSAPATSSAATAPTAPCATLIGLDMTDRAFFYDWLIVDVIFDEPRTFDPLNVQICDPARPTTVRVRRTGTAPLGVHGAARRVDRPASTTRRPRGDSSSRWDASPTTPASSVTPSTGSRPAGWRSGGEVACCSPATPPTRRHPSPGRACAPGCATPPTWRGSSTSCSPALSPDALLDAYGTERAPNMRGRHRAGHRDGQDDLRLRPRRGRARDEMFLAADDGGITDIPPFPGDQRRASSSPGSPKRRRAVRPGRRRGATACASASTTPSAPDGASSPTARSALDARPRRLVREHRRRRRGRRR